MASPGMAPAFPKDIIFDLARRFNRSTEELARHFSGDSLSSEEARVAGLVVASLATLGRNLNEITPPQRVACIRLAFELFRKVDPKEMIEWVTRHRALDSGFAIERDFRLCHDELMSRETERLCSQFAELVQERAGAVCPREANDVRDILLNNS